MLIDFKDEDFENKIKSEDVSVIQFSATWCGPCKNLKPIMSNYMKEKKIRMVIDKKSMLLADEKLDITEDIMKILNNKIKSIKLN